MRTPRWDTKNNVRTNLDVTGRNGTRRYYSHNPTVDQSWIGQKVKGCSFSLYCLSEGARREGGKVKGGKDAGMK